MLLYSWVYKYFLTNCFNYYWCIFTSDITGWHDVNNSVFNFWGTIILHSIAATPFSIPNSSAYGFQFLQVLAKICCLLSCFGSGYPNSCELVFQWNNNNTSLALIRSILNVQNQNQTTHLLLHVQFVKLLASKSF